VKRAIYFGAGSDAGRLMARHAAAEDVVCFVDNDPVRHGTRFNGRPILPPSAIHETPHDHVRIACGSTWPVYQQLLALGVPADRIVADLLAPRNVAFMRSLRGRHAGRRAFVVGNGPSLRAADLDAIHDAGDVSFAFNKIDLIFDRTRFRPTYYMVDDLLVAQHNVGRIESMHGCTKLLPDVLLRWIEPDDETYLFGFTFQHGTAEKSLISDDPLHLYSGATVTYSALQMALVMGCSPIVLVGVDFRFVEPPPSRADGNVFEHGGEVNHFDPAYRVPGEKWFRPDQAFARRSYESALRSARAHGIEILNATRGGALEVFPRVPFDALVQEALA
jgi:hypothetical protein